MPTEEEKEKNLQSTYEEALVSSTGSDSSTGTTETDATDTTDTWDSLREESAKDLLDANVQTELASNFASKALNQSLASMGLSNAGYGSVAASNLQANRQSSLNANQQAYNEAIASIDQQEAAETETETTDRVTSITSGLSSYSGNETGLNNYLSANGLTITDGVITDSNGRFSADQLADIQLAYDSALAGYADETESETATRASSIVSGLSSYSGNEAGISNYLLANGLSVENGVVQDLNGRFTADQLADIQLAYDSAMSGYADDDEEAVALRADTVVSTISGGTITTTANYEAFLAQYGLTLNDDGTIVSDGTYSYTDEQLSNINYAYSAATGVYDNDEITTGKTGYSIDGIPLTDKNGNLVSDWTSVYTTEYSSIYTDVSNGTITDGTMVSITGTIGDYTNTNYLYYNNGQWYVVSKSEYDGYNGNKRSYKGSSKSNG